MPDLTSISVAASLVPLLPPRSFPLPTTTLHMPLTAGSSPAHLLLRLDSPSLASSMAPSPPHLAAATVASLEQFSPPVQEPACPTRSRAATALPDPASTISTRASPAASLCMKAWQSKSQQKPSTSSTTAMFFRSTTPTSITQRRRLRLLPPAAPSLDRDASLLIHLSALQPAPPTSSTALARSNFWAGLFSN